MLQAMIPACITGMAVFGISSIVSLASLLAELGYKPDEYAVQELKKVLLFCVSLTFLSALALGWIVYLTDAV